MSESGPTQPAADLDELERRVLTKWAAAAAARMPENAFDPAGWGIDTSDWNTDSLPPGTPQFPREQWVSYPNKRVVSLMMVDRMLDFDELTDEQWMQVCMVMLYGGKTRIA